MKKAFYEVLLPALSSLFHKDNSILRMAFRVLSGILLALLIHKVPVDNIEAIFYDWRIRTAPTSEVSGRVHLIFLNTKTLEKTVSYPDANSFYDLYSSLIAASPRRIVSLISFDRIEGSKEDKQKLADLIKKADLVTQATDQLTPKGEPELKLPPPFEFIPVRTAPPTWDRNVLAKDGVTRRMMLFYQDEWMLHPILAAEYNPEAINLSRLRGRFEFFEAEQARIAFLPQGSFSTFEWTEVTDGLKDLSDMKDDIILIGDDLNQDSKQYVMTPFDRSVKGMTLTELHANIIETLIKNSSPYPLPDFLNLFFTILISVLTVHVVLKMKPGKGILLLMSVAATFVLFAWLIYSTTGAMLVMTYPLLAIFLVYYFFIPYRLIVENRKSWEYYQKHQLLSEVEKLKTNFIGMMSHDLKTPLARIQGMTDVIAQGMTPMSSIQREALDTIRQSSEDLLKFISTILNYAQIESKGVELNLVSKDINSLLKEVSKKHEFLAKLKHIQLILELEPLFSVNVDPDLLKQVFSNLIENAIKYSPENSKVLVTSEEVDGWIQVQISDQGMGIPEDEVENIFSKFFRSKNAKSSPIKGSGLGLYLAKYFVELHGGRIQAESSPGLGSTFTVELPIQK